MGPNSLQSGSWQLEATHYFWLVRGSESFWVILFFFLENFLVVCRRLKSTWVVHFLSPFLYTLALPLILCSNLLFSFIVFWVDTLMMTWLFFVTLHLRILSVTNLKSISIFVGCIEYLQFCLEINSAILHYIVNIELIILWQFFTIFEHYNWHEFDFCLLVLGHTLSSVIDDLENFAVLKFSNGVWRWQNWFVFRGCHWSSKICGEFVPG